MERRKYQWIIWMLFAVIFAIEVTGTDICRVSAAGSAPADAKEWCGHFYKVFEEEVSVLEAKSKCEDMGGYLVTITSGDEQRFVDQLLEGEHDHFWVGLYRKEYKEKAVWMNGEENVMYQEFIHPHPLYGGGGYYPYYYCIDRAGLNSIFFYYFSKNGSIKHKYVCEWGGRMDIANAKITLSQDKLEIINHYSEIAHKPDSITVEYTGLSESHVLEEGRDYDLEITNNTGIGEATVKITGKGRFAGSKITHFDIVPEKGEVRKTEVDLDRNIVFKWYKTNGEMTSYEIEYADNENFYQSDIVRLSGMRALSYQYTFLNVERSTTYYFRVRACKTVNGKDYKGEWSDTHSQYSGNLLVASDFWGFGNDEYLIGKEYFEKFFGPETAREFSEKKGYNGNNGICTGMCIAGLASVYWDTPGVSSFGVQSLSEIKDPQKKSSAFDGKWSALDYCKFAHTIKQTVDASEERADTFGKLSQLYYRVKGAQKDGIGIIIALMGVDEKGNDSDGHTVMGLGVKETETEVLLKVYDPNYPGKEDRFIHLYRDSTNKYAFTHWSYESKGIKWEGTDGITGYQSGSRNDRITYCTKLQKDFVKAFHLVADSYSLLDYVLMSFDELPEGWGIRDIEDWLDVPSRPNAWIDVAQFLDGSGRSGNSGSHVIWVKKKENGISLKNIPAGVSITVAAPYHSVKIKVDKKADLVITAGDSISNSVKINTAQKAGFTVTFSDSAKGSAQSERKIITGTAAAGTETKVKQEESGIKVTGVLALQATSRKGTENKNGQMINPVVHNTSAVTLDASGTYQITESNSKLQVKGSSHNNGVYDEVVASGDLKVSYSFKQGNLKYRITQLTGKSGSVKVTGAVSKTKTSVTVPDTVTVKGVKLNVTSIGSKAFAGMTKLSSIRIGKKVTVIGKSAFQNDKKLKKITIESTALKSVGTDAVKGIHSQAVIYVPKSKTAAYQKLFGKKTGITSQMCVLETGSKSYVVRFVDGKKTVKTMRIQAGKNASAPKLTRKGYTLSWSTSYKKVKKNLTVKAVWTADLPAKGTVRTVGTLKYKVTKSAKKGGTVQVTGVRTKTSASYRIPSTVKIGTCKFTVTSVGAKAFSGCSKVNKITLPGTITSIDKKAFTGMAKNVKFSLPESEKKRLEKLLEKAGV